MKNYDQFHDGSLDGLLIEGTSVQVFISTDTKGAFVLAASGVAALAADGFKAGNIIFEVLTKQSAEVTLRDMTDVYGLPADDKGRDQAQKLLEKAQQRNLIVLEVNPSYGATCLVLAESVELLDRREWADRVLHTTARG